MENVTIEEKVYLVALTIISVSIIYLAWGYDAPIGDFAKTFGGLLLGHTITEALNTRRQGEDE